MSKHSAGLDAGPGVCGGSFLIKLAMLSATLSLIAWMGWTVPPNLPQASSPATPVLPVEASPRPSPVKTGLNINHATLQEFDQLPGIGPALAQRIIDHRRLHGPFATVEDLLSVKGIGPTKLARLRGLITVGSEPMPSDHKGRL